MTTMTGLEAVQMRISALQARFPQAPVRVQTTSSVSFDQVLGAVRTSAATPVRTPGSGSAATTGADIIDAAKQYLGVPYLWGGTDPDVGLDCSGLVQRVYADHGIEVPRVSRDQARAGRPVESLDAAQPGDLVAFGSPVDHIGIFLGDNKMIVAPKAGDVVKVQEIYRTPTAIRRILPDEAPGLGSLTALTSPTLPTGSSSPYDALFARAAQRYSVPAPLLSAIAKAESAYDPDAVSPAGALGLMQIMPGTARELGVDPLNPPQAVDGAARLIAQHLRDFGSTELALAAYNAGPGAVRKYGGVPPYAETQTYVQRVMRYAGLSS